MLFYSWHEPYRDAIKIGKTGTSLWGRINGYCDIYNLCYQDGSRRWEKLGGFDHKLIEQAARVYLLDQNCPRIFVTATRPIRWGFPTTAEVFDLNGRSYEEVADAVFGFVRGIKQVFSTAIGGSPWREGWAWPED